MASRRTRIKGIANIPQRRKTGPNLQDEVSLPQIEPKPVEKVQSSPRPSPCASPIGSEPHSPSFVKPNTDKIVVLNNTIISYPSQQIDEFRKSPSPKLDYPIPPSSPSKQNRSRIKAVPRLGQRHASLSASESEDESKKSYRIRNDSVCSSTSTQDNIDCPSPQKPKEFNSVIQRKCRRTDQSRKLAEARRDFYQKFGNNKPDRQKLTMIDLIFYNPTTSPMPQKKPEQDSETPPEIAEGEAPLSDEENDTPAAPQIKIDQKGDIVVDEKSLMIENIAVKKHRSDIQKSKLIDGNAESAYGVYKRAKRSKDWGKDETLKFYKALNVIGTDFTLMCELFPRRSRRELKMKFKKEERINKNLIDKAIMQPCTFNYNDLKDEIDMEERQLLEVQKQKEREKEMKKEVSRKRTTSTSSSKTSRKKKRKSLSIMNVLDSDSESDDGCFVDDLETQRKTVQRPTRSGRIPRRTGQRSVSVSSEKEPGSLMVVTSTGSEGQPLYKVFMVTGKDDSTQVGEDVGSLSEAMELKDNQNLKSIFTLTASRIVTGPSGDFHDDEMDEENNVSIYEENNVTIPAENNVTIPAENNVTIPAEHNVTIPAENLHKLPS